MTTATITDIVAAAANNNNNKDVVIASFVEKLLTLPKVRIRDVVTVQQKIRKIAEAGLEKFMVLADFDFTLTAHRKGQKKGHATADIFWDVDRQKHAEYIEKSSAMVKHYHKIEHCPTMTIEQKMPHMFEWWEREIALVAHERISKQQVVNTVDRMDIFLRENCSQLLTMFKQCEIPVIVFSAGYGDVIEEVFRQQLRNNNPDVQDGSSSMWPLSNMHIITNWLQFDEQNIVVGLSQPIITTFNKNSTVIGPAAHHDGTVMREIHERTSVLLLGDSMGDVHMDLGVQNEQTIFRVGFFNKWDGDGSSSSSTDQHLEMLLAKYMAEYDIVLLDDPTMDVPIQLMEQIIFKI